ncbi:MAG: Rieske 2Fe-2S domain-containing protein, partial [Alphaproteobacteria bacterium]|nr:Rieske 2Fe-2S domain-containing protein [Alphaproteobacteria bacterium]
MEDPMWPENCWYIAGFAHELERDGERRLLARRLLDRAVVIWRTGDGKLAALQDRCPHRLVPLSTGKLAGDHVECGYHGLRFDASGACAFVPGQDTLPKGAPVKIFPIAERHALLWIWFGPAA